MEITTTTDLAKHTLADTDSVYQKNIKSTLKGTVRSCTVRSGFVSKFYV